MEYKVQIGQAAFLIHTPCPYNWTETDRGFLHWDGTAAKTVEVHICHAPAELPARKPDLRDRSCDTWLEEDAEIRAYRAAFWPGHPLYAVSRRSGDRVDITFCGNFNLWNHPNMQLWNLMHLENYLLETEGIVLHCCYTEYRGQAILFTAPSGTGKTTQAGIWQRTYGSRIVNGDKCLLQRVNGRWLACGFPHHGSADECENEAFPIAAIAIVRQAKTDRVEDLGPARRLGLLYSECTVNTWSPHRVTGAMDLLTDLAVQIPAVMLHCTMEDTAAHVLHRHIFGETNGTV